MSDSNVAKVEPRSTPDNLSVHSISSEQSDRSTLNYSELEPWDLFQSRVEQLCEILWPPQQSQKRRFLIWKTEVLARISGNRFLCRPGPRTEVPTIERLRGGDNNRVAGITIPTVKREENQKLILRVPRWGQGDVSHMVATLQYVSQNSAIPVAEIIAKDFSSDNPLNSPYTVQRRLPGSDLQTLWSNLTHPQRCSVASQLGSVVKSLLSLESAVTGRIQTSAMADTEKLYKVMPFGFKNVRGDDYEESDQQVILPGYPRESQSTLDFFKCQIDGWRAIDFSRNAGELDHMTGLWDSMGKIVDDMSEMGMFTTDIHCLCHTDLLPRNIMAQIQPDSSIKVTGILDWDEAVVAPKFVCCEPPGWLWGYDCDNYARSNFVCYPYEMPGADDVPSISEQQELKCIFEEQAGPGYLRMAYDAHFRISRGLFRIALFGLNSSEYFEATKRLISDWDILRQTLRI